MLLFLFSLCEMRQIMYLISLNLDSSSIVPPLKNKVIPSQRAFVWVTAIGKAGSFQGSTWESSDADEYCTKKKNIQFFP